MGWSYEREWFEETNIVLKLVNYLKKEGWDIIKFNKNKRAKGPDIIAKKKEKQLIVEVKGYPSDKYVLGPKKGEKKKTSQNLQARHWFSEALLQVLLAKEDKKADFFYIALPKVNFYENLVSKLENTLKILKIGCFFVDKTGRVWEKIKIT